MMDTLKSKVVAELRRIANGGAPHGIIQTGLCKAVRNSPDFKEIEDQKAYNLVNDASERFFPSGYVFSIGDFGPERLTLAGFLAAIIEDEA